MLVKPVIIQFSYVLNNEPCWLGYDINGWFYCLVHTVIIAPCQNILKSELHKFFHSNRLDMFNTEARCYPNTSGASILVLGFCVVISVLIETTPVYTSV